jgi:hypothetical protein
VLCATIAAYWDTPGGPRWAAAAWLLPVVVVVAMLFSTLWQLLGSRHTVGSARRGPRHGERRRIPRDPKAHLRELRRWGDYWAVTLRLPAEGACESARAARKQMFDLYRAPSLPLPGCSNARCACGYSGLKERRRRDVLPSGLERDRRAGAVIAWPGRARPSAPPPRDRSNPLPAVAPLAEAARL